MELRELIKTYLLTQKNNKLRIESQRIKRSWFKNKGIEDLFNEHEEILSNPEELTKVIDSLDIIPKMEGKNFTNKCIVEECSNKVDFISIGLGFKKYCSNECMEYFKSEQHRKTRARNSGKEFIPRIMKDENKPKMTIQEVIKTYFISTFKGTNKLESQRIKRSWFKNNNIEYLFNDHKELLTNPEELSKIVGELNIIKSKEAYNFTGKCSMCSKDTEFKSIGRGFKDCCSSECSAKKKERNHVEIHGVKHQMNRTEVKDKIKKTNLEKYGFEHAGQSDEVKSKIKRTNLERYGCENTFQFHEFKEKAKSKRLELYGGEYTLNSPELLQRVLKTKLEVGEDGLNSHERMQEFRLNDIDEDGLNSYEREVLSKRNNIDEDGLNSYERVHQNRLDSIDEDGLNAYERMHQNRLNDIDSNGFNSYERAYLKALDNPECKWIHPSRRTDKFNYYKQVWLYTNRNDLSVLENIDKRGYKFQEVPHSLDHKYSIKQGFINGIPPYIIGSIWNLEMLRHSDNVRKGSSCSITLDELCERIFRHKKSQ